MTRKISLITAVAVSALAVGVPTAFGEGRLAGSQEPTAINTYRDANERGGVQQAATQSALNGYRDAFERAAPVKSLESSLTGYVDANERGASTQGFGSKLATYHEGAERAVVPAGPVAVPPISSGGELEWPQIGIGFGIGIVLMFGLWLAMRMKRIRPLAH